MLFEPPRQYQLTYVPPKEYEYDEKGADDGRYIPTQKHRGQ